VRQPPENPVLFSDNLDFPSSSQMVPQSLDPSRWMLSYQGGEYLIQAKSPNIPYINVQVGPPAPPSDAMLSVDVRVVGPSRNAAVSALCRYHPTIRHFYSLTVIPDDHIAALSRSDGRDGAVMAATTDPVIRPGNETNRIAISCRGELIEGYVNGVRVVSAQDRSLGSGNMMVSAGWEGDEPVLWDVRFDNLTISRRP
jgi:hypothetical protein